MLVCCQSRSSTHDPVGGSEPRRTLADHGFDRTDGAGEVIAHRARGTPEMVAVPVAVHGDLVSALGHQARDPWVALDLGAEQEEGRVDVEPLERVEDPRRGRRTRAVVEGQGDVVVEADASDGWVEPPCDPPVVGERRASVVDERCRTHDGGGMAPLHGCDLTRSAPGRARARSPERRRGGVLPAPGGWTPRAPVHSRRRRWDQRLRRWNRARSCLRALVAG